MMDEVARDEPYGSTIRQPRRRAMGKEARRPWAAWNKPSRAHVCGPRRAAPEVSEAASVALRGSNTP